MENDENVMEKNDKHCHDGHTASDGHWTGIDGIRLGTISPSKAISSKLLKYNIPKVENSLELQLTQKENDASCVRINATSDSTKSILA